MAAPEEDAEIGVGVAAMSDRITDTIAAVFAEDECIQVVERHRNMAEAVVAALKAQHIALVPLPQPDKPNRWDLAVDRVMVEDGQVVTGVKGLTTLYDSPKMARERAAALLAAAAAAEAVNA